jgi:hypothetical protein
MKLKMKLMAAAIALVAASGANAAISNTNNGELFITVYDPGTLGANTDDRSYVRELGSLANGTNLGGALNNWAPGAVNPVLEANKQGFGTIFSLAADSNLNSFIAGTDDTSRLRWNIVAGDNVNARRLLSTADSISTLPTFAQLRTVIDTKWQPYTTNANTAGIADGGSLIRTGASAGLAGWGSNFGGSGFTNADVLGGSLGFFVLSETVNSGSSATLALTQQFKASETVAMEWTLANNGLLTYGAVAAIPEPSEYALMLAGLGMLGFMARRRLNNRA